MIKFENVSKQFPLGNKALDSISFKVNKGEFTYLVGPSGAGKTTILKMILKQSAPTSGSIFIDETQLDWKDKVQTENIRRGIGVVFQDFKILHGKNIFENVALGLNILGESNKNIISEVNQALKLVGILDKKEMFPAQLSAGEVQRAAIARAVIGNRDIILADEPTGNLDPTTSWEIMKIFKKLEKDKTIIFATHNTDVVNSYRKRVITLKDGKIIKDEKKGGYSL
ncbi:MAG: ATP-binding cassette domain-containing protein [Patescibacteria group bacterium]